MSVRFIAGDEKGNRVQEIRVHGQPLEKERNYTVAACRRVGEPEDTLCRIPDVENPKVLQLDAHEAVRRYLRKHDPVTPPPERRVVAEDLPDTVHSQYYAIQHLKKETRRDKKAAAP
jgi:hypothetical protein